MVQALPMQLSERPYQNPYIKMMSGDYSVWTLNEEQAKQNKGQWRQDCFVTNNTVPLDLEIGVGNGFFFSHQAVSHPERNLVGIELKFKPLVQTIRRAIKDGAKNVRAVRIDANHIDRIFEKNELDNVFIHFPDPWPKRRTHKNRLIQTEFLNRLYELQKNGSYIEFKTDNANYFEWVLKAVELSPYQIARKSYDLHQSEWAQENFMTHFEKLWTGQGLKTHYLRLQKNHQ